MNLVSLVTIPLASPNCTAFAFAESMLPEIVPLVTIKFPVPSVTFPVDTVTFPPTVRFADAAMLLNVTLAAGFSSSISVSVARSTV